MWKLASSWGEPKEALRKNVGWALGGDNSFKEGKNKLALPRFLEANRGYPHVFYKEGIKEIITLQDVGGKCKPYQVKQMRAVLKKYNLREEL